VIYVDFVFLNSKNKTFFLLKTKQKKDYRTYMSIYVYIYISERITSIQKCHHHQIIIGHQAHVHQDVHNLMDNCNKRRDQQVYQKDK
jgi:hypothetical protein